MKLCDLQPRVVRLLDRVAPLTYEQRLEQQRRRQREYWQSVGSQRRRERESRA